jgi:hypothetical protein
METERFLETSLSACKSRQRQDKESSYLYDTPDLEVWGSTLNWVSEDLSYYLFTGKKGHEEEKEEVIKTQRN